MSKATKIISFIGLTIAMFMGTLDSTIVNIALPKIMTHFNASLTDTSWVATIYTLALAVFMITGSKIADRYGRKKIMLLGLSHSRFNRRARQLLPLIYLIRQTLNQEVDLSGKILIIDSFPVPVCQPVRNYRVKIFHDIADIGYKVTKNVMGSRFTQ